MILVTGAGGKTGRAIVQALAARGTEVRAWVWREAQVSEAKQNGASQVVWGDITDKATLDRAMGGATAVYHICPNMQPDEVGIGEEVIAAALRHQLTHFVYHSVLHPQTRDMPHHWQKNQVEEKLFMANIPYTILQPAAYMQNILAGWEHITRQGIFANPYPITTRLSLVDVYDVAEVAAAILTTPGHTYATYELVGTRPLTQTEVAVQLSGALDRPIVAQGIPLAEWQTQAAPHLSRYALNTLLQMFRYYAQHGLEGNPTVLQSLLSRPPTNLVTFIRRTQSLNLLISETERLRDSWRSP